MLAEGIPSASILFRVIWVANLPSLPQGRLAAANRYSQDHDQQKYEQRKCVDQLLSHLYLRLLHPTASNIYGTS
jgi:hypothetical protein